VSFGLCKSSGILKNTMFRKLNVSAHRCKDSRDQLFITDTTEQVPPTLRTETDTVSETSCSVEYQAIDKPENSLIQHNGCVS
jgi:hypothetical protein